MSTGFVLNIPQEMLNRLEDADKKIEKLAKTSEDAQTRIVSAFKSINTHGIDAFINKLTEAQTKLSQLGSTQINIGVNTTAIDEINGVIRAVERVRTVTGGASMAKNPFVDNGLGASIAKLNEEIERAKKNFAELQNRFTHLSSPAGDKTAVTSIQNEAQFLMEYIRVLGKEKDGLIVAKNALAEANKTLQQKDPFKAKVDDLSRESLEARRYKDSMQAMKEFYAEQDKEMKKAAKEAEADRKKREKEEKATADRIAAYDSKARRERYKAYTTTYEGAMRTSDRAKTLLQEQQAIKNLEAARAKLNKTDSDYANKLRNLNQRILEHKNNIDKATAGSKNLQKQHRSLMDISGQLARRLALVFSVSQITGYVKKLIEVRGEFELQQRSLQAILQNKDEANRIWQQTVDLAVRSPFRVKELVSYTKQLAAYRIESDKLFETNKMLADISAGLGVDMQRLILAFGQVRSAAYLRGTELRQFTEAGIPILEQLAQYFTELEGRAVSVGDVFERVSKRMVSFADVEEIFRRMTSEGGTFYRMQEIQAETLQGQISNFKDSVDIMLNEIGKANEGTLKSSVKFVRSLVENWEALVKAIKATIAVFAMTKLNAILAKESIKLLATDMGVLTNATQTQLTITQLLKVGYISLTKTIKGVGAAMKSLWVNNPWTLIIMTVVAAIWKLVSVHKAHKEAIEEVNKAFEESRNRMKEISIDFTYASGKGDLDTARKKLAELIALANNEYSMNIEVNLKELTEDELKEYFVYLRQKMNEANAFAQTFVTEMQKMTEWTFTADIMESASHLSSGATQYMNYLQEASRKAIYALQEQERQAGELSVSMREALDNLLPPQGEQEDDITYLERLQKGMAILEKEALSLYSKSLNSGSRKENKYWEQQYLTFKDNFLTPTKVGIGELTEKSEFRFWLSDFKMQYEEFLNSIYVPDNMSDDDKRMFFTVAIDKAQSQQGWNDFVRDYIERWTEKRFEFQFVPKPVDPQTLDPWAERVKEAISEVNNKIKSKSESVSDADLFPLPKVGQTKEAYLALAKEVIGIAEMTYNETQQIEDESMVNRTKALSPYADEVKKVLNLFKDDTKGKDDTAIKILNKRIGLIKEMYSEYQKGEKIIGDEAEKQVSDAYAKTFKEAFEDTGINLTGLVIDKEKLTELQNAGNEAGEVFSEAMLAKMNEVAEAGTYIRNISDKAKDQIKLDEGFVGYIYDDAEKSKVKTQIKTLEELYKYFDKATGKAKEVKGQGTLTIGYGHALQTLDEAKKYLGITLEQADAEELLTKDIKDRVAPLNRLLDTYNELIVTQEQYDTLFNNFYQGGLSRALRMAFSDSTSELEGYIKGLDEDLSSWGSSFAQEWGDNWLEEFKQLETKAERFAKVLEIASVTTVASGSHIDKNQFYGENAMKARSARRAAEFRGDLEIVKLLEKAAVDVSQIDFTNIEGVVAILERLRPIAEKEGEEAVNTLNQAISKFTAEIGFTTKKDADKELLAQVQQLFDQYDLSLELKKLNIPPDLAKSLFDVDYLDLDGLKKAVMQQREYFVGKDMLDEYDDLIQKIGELSKKAQEEEAKEFVNFLKKNLDEIKLIQDKGAYNIALADRLFGEGKITAEQYMSAIRQIVSKTNEEVAKINLDKFKDSSLYIKAMGDLAAYTREELEAMAKALEDALANNAGDMGVDEIQAYHEALKRINKEQEKFEPFFSENNIAKLLKYKDLEDKYNKVKEEHIKLLEEEARLKKEAEQAERDLDSLESERLFAQEGGDNTLVSFIEEKIKATKTQAVEIEKALESVNGQIADSSAEMSNISGQMGEIAGGASGALMMVDMIIKEVYNTINAAIKVFEDAKELAESFGKETDKGSWREASDAFNLIGNFNEEVMAGWENLKSGNVIGAVANTVGSILGFIRDINKAIDSDYAEEIANHAEKVEDLQKAYEKLEESIEEAYSIEQMQQYNEELERNVELQIASYKAMIAAENAKKDTDTEQIEAWNEELEDLTKQWEDLKDSLLEGVGGVAESSFRSQTREFVDAWVSSFQETGDGLKGLKGEFRDFFDNIIAEQAALRVTEKFLEPFYKSLNTALGDFELTMKESKDLREEADKIMPELSAALELIWTQLGGSRGEAEGAGLSALQKGISSLSESTGQVLEALLNSMRFYVADSNAKLTQLLNNMMSGETESPMLAELRAQTKWMRDIYNLINGMTSTHPSGGRGIKTVM